VYTRKSSEEGLEQDFNSLQAQREACEAYIASQRGEGWRLVPTHYDDGGLSGGTMERPALRKLLADIEAGGIDVVVVYKVDRLTRSLSDFSKMVEVFDRHSASFVAVTQHFNTTSSMGRLTLNVLLSFAQFEREVTGERIRDKIAASKKKGMWLGGPVPLGYEVRERKLVVVPEEAETVRYIFRRYSALSGVPELAAELRKGGIRSKSRNGKPSGCFYRGALYALLSNPIYIGQTRHKDACYPGQHARIVDVETWELVKQKLKAQAVRDGLPNRKTAFSPLMGKLMDEAGGTLRPSHAIKKGRRYRYYISPPERAESNPGIPIWRLPAQEIEKRVEMIVRDALEDWAGIAQAALKVGVPEGSIDQVLAAAKKIDSWSSAVQRVRLGGSEIRVTLAIPFAPVIYLERVVPVQMRRRGVESRLVIQAERNHFQASADPALVKAVGRAMRWWEMLNEGKVKSIPEIAAQEGMKERYVQRVLPLAMLAPDIVEAIAAGRQPADLTAQTLLLRTEIPVCWKTQRQLLGFR
jgi:DNA invertase Pin-like site-specific DNA recombinase